MFDDSSWSVHPSLKLIEGRSCHMSALIGSKLFVMGGFDGNSCLSSIEMADLS